MSSDCDSSFLYTCIPQRVFIGRRGDGNKEYLADNLLECLCNLVDDTFIQFSCMYRISREATLEGGIPWRSADELKLTIVWNTCN